MLGAFLGGKWICDLLSSTSCKQYFFFEEIFRSDNGRVWFNANQMQGKTLAGRLSTTQTLFSPLSAPDRGERGLLLTLVELAHAHAHSHSRSLARTLGAGVGGDIDVDGEGNNPTPSLTALCDYCWLAGIGTPSQPATELNSIAMATRSLGPILIFSRDCSPILIQNFILT